MNTSRSKLRRTPWLLALALAVFLALPEVGSTADLPLRDGTKYEVTGDQLFLLDRAGKKVLAPDGTYPTRDGRTLIVKNGRVALGRVDGGPGPAPAPGQPGSLAPKAATTPPGAGVAPRLQTRQKSLEISGGSGSAVQKGGAAAPGPVMAPRSSPGPQGSTAIAPGGGGASWSGPDLVVTGPEVVFDQMGSGGWGTKVAVVFIWTVQNVGAADTPSTKLKVTCKGLAGGSGCPEGLAGDSPVGPLAAKIGTFAVSRKMADPKDKPMRFELTATADSENVVKELIESNNVRVSVYEVNVPQKSNSPVAAASSPGTLVPSKGPSASNQVAAAGSLPPPPAPDLALELEQGKSFTPGQEVWVIVRNKGAVDAGSFVVTFECHDKVKNMNLDWMICTGMVPNAPVTISGVPAGSFQPVGLLKPKKGQFPYEITVRADPSNFVEDKNLADNVLVFTNP